jgi:hypothetical protein
MYFEHEHHWRPEAGPAGGITVTVEYGKKRWRTGWVVLPKAPTEKEVQAHRPNPANLAVSMWRRKLNPNRPVLTERPTDVLECGKCLLAIGKARRRALAAYNREMEARRTAKQRSGKTIKIVAPEDVDRYDRQRMRGTSFRTVGGFRPGEPN